MKSDVTGAQRPKWKSVGGACGSEAINPWLMGRVMVRAGGRWCRIAADAFLIRAALPRDGRRQPISDNSPICHALPGTRW